MQYAGQLRQESTKRHNKKKKKETEKVITHQFKSIRFLQKRVVPDHLQQSNSQERKHRRGERSFFSQVCPHRAMKTPLFVLCLVSAAALLVMVVRGMQELSFDDAAAYHVTIGHDSPLLFSFEITEDDSSFVDHRPSLEFYMALLPDLEEYQVSMTYWRTDYPISGSDAGGGGSESDSSDDDFPSSSNEGSSSRDHSRVDLSIVKPTTHLRLLDQDQCHSGCLIYFSLILTPVDGQVPPHLIDLDTSIGCRITSHSGHAYAYSLDRPPFVRLSPGAYTQDFVILPGQTQWIDAFMNFASYMKISKSSPLITLLLPIDDDSLPTPENYSQAIYEDSAVLDLHHGSNVIGVHCSEEITEAVLYNLRFEYQDEKGVPLWVYLAITIGFGTLLLLLVGVVIAFILLRRGGGSSSSSTVTAEGSSEDVGAAASIPYAEIQDPQSHRHHKKRSHHHRTEPSSVNSTFV